MDRIKKFKNYNENLGLSFNEMFNMYIKDKKVVDFYNGDPLYTDGRKQYGITGVLLENGWKYGFSGGGSSGEDVVNTYIISKKYKILSYE